MRTLYMVVALVAGVMIAAMAVSGWQTPVTWQAPTPAAIGLFPLNFRVDRLAAVFLLLLGVVTCCCVVFSRDYLKHLGPRINTSFFWIALIFFVCGMCGTIVSADGISFLVLWEVMSLSSAALIVCEFNRHKADKSALIYLVATRVATGLLTFGFVSMYSVTGSWAFQQWNFTDPQTWVASALILCGLCIKSGTWPFHIWLPYAHPEAPGPVSALMSGVMVKVAIYAAIRFFVQGNLNNQVLIWVLLGLALISVFWGVLFAINQSDLKRLLAYSTVENVGIIMLGLSLTLWTRSRGWHVISEMAFAAMLFHCCAHGLFKSLLFLGASAVDSSAHTRRLTLLGGLMKRMRWTALFFMIGTVSICSVPPLNGFIGKWCLYQALLHASVQAVDPIERAIPLLAIGVLGCAGALVVACFAKAAGVAFLGRPRSIQSSSAKEASVTMLIPQLVLAVLCIGMGLVSPKILKVLGQIYSELSGAQSLSPVTGLQILPMAGLLLVLTILFFALVIEKTPRRYITWDCGFGATNEKAQVTADSFAQPIARIFSPVFRFNVAIDISGKDRRHFPERISVLPSMVSLLETKIYGPATECIRYLSRLVARLQAGSIHLYLLYLCVTMAILVLLGVRIR